MVESKLQLSEKIGQHLLIDHEALGFIASHVIDGANVIEIGPGTGNLTSLLAKKAHKVIGLEIDKRFEPDLSEITAKRGNVEIIFGDALGVAFDRLINQDKSREWQIIGNIPYHISEPLLTKVAGLAVEDIILTVGDHLAYLLQLDNPQNLSFGRLSLLSQTFFNTHKLKTLPKDCFYPQPRTESAVVRLTPRTKAEYNHPRLRLQRQLFLTQNSMSTLKKVLSEALALVSGQTGTMRSKKEHNRHSRRAARQEFKGWLRNWQSAQQDKVSFSPSVKDLGLPESILSTPFARLDNQQIQQLTIALQKKFGA